MISSGNAARFDGRTVVVTGAGRAGQVGEAVAREFGKRGATVVVVDRDAGRAGELAAALQRDGLAVSGFGCDLADANATTALARAIAGTSGGQVYALANVAGGFATSGPVADSDPAILMQQYTINVASAYGATRAFLPFLRPARGAIVFMAAAVVLPGAKVSGMSAYVVAKAGVVALMRTVAQEERSNGVRANALAPTAIRTVTNLGSMGDKFPYVEREAVAAMIAFLCSDAAANVTGQVIELA